MEQENCSMSHQKSQKSHVIQHLENSNPSNLAFMSWLKSFHKPIWKKKHLTLLKNSGPFLLSLAVVSFTDIGVIQGWSRWMHQLLLVHSNSPVKLVNNWESFHERNERNISTRLSIPVDPKTAQSKCSSFAKLSSRFCVVLRSRNVFWTAMLPGAAQMVNLCFQICTWTFSVSFFWSNKIWRFFRVDGCLIFTTWKHKTVGKLRDRHGLSW